MNRCCSALKKATPGAGAQRPGRGPCLARHFPVGLETTEVIDADQVDPLQEGVQAVDPPGEALLLVHLPAVERVAPELPRRAEEIGWNPGLNRRPAALVQEEEVGPGPDVRTVMRREDRDVADELDLLLRASLAKGLHLGLEDVLDELVKTNGRGQLVSPPCQRGGLAASPGPAPTRTRACLPRLP